MSPIVALTGGTGFIGQALWQSLEGAGWIVRPLIRPASLKKYHLNVNNSFIQGSLEDENSLRTLVKGAHAVVHCAGRVQGDDSAKFHRVNVEAVARLARIAAAQNPPPRFILISSLAAREPNLSDYAMSKYEGEMALSHSAGDMRWIVFRPPAVYGLHDRHLLPLFRWIKRGVGVQLGPNDARFSLLFVDDLARAVVQWLDVGHHEGRAYELHDGRDGGYSWQDVFNIVAQGSTIRLRVPTSVLFFLAGVNPYLARILRYEPMLTLGKVRELRHPNWVCDNAPLSRVLNWNPLISLEEGVRRVLSSGGQTAST